MLLHTVHTDPRPSIRSHRLLAFMASLCCLLMLSSCSVDDDVDLCCERIVIHFRYSKGGSDQFPQYIHTLKHFIFDSKGMLHQVIEGRSDDLQEIILTDYLSGMYNIISVANASDATLLSEAVVGHTTMDDFMLSLRDYTTSDDHSNADRLYWSTREFTAVPSKKLSYIADLSNVHCILHVTIRWAGSIPGGDEPYTIKLSGVPALYDQNPALSRPIIVSGDHDTVESTSDRIVHRFPAVPTTTPALVTHYVQSPIIAGRVKTELVTFRYTDEYIPSIQVFRGSVITTKLMDLRKAFRAWNWVVDKNIEQVYNIEIIINEDGSITLRPEGSAEVIDWIDGGYI